MWRTLRAFAWMRWRVLMNSLERTAARDTIERFSLAVEQIGPLIAFGLLVPSALALAAIGGYAGYWLPSSERVITFDAIRLLLLVSSGLSIVGPILMPTLERTSAVRLLLLPIPRGTLYLSQASTTVSDPWIILVIPIVMAMPIGSGDRRRVRRGCRHTRRRRAPARGAGRPVGAVHAPSAPDRARSPARRVARAALRGGPGAVHAPRIDERVADQRATAGGTRRGGRATPARRGVDRGVRAARGPAGGSRCCHRSCSQRRRGLASTGGAGSVALSLVGLALAARWFTGSAS